LFWGEKKRENGEFLGCDPLPGSSGYMEENLPLSVTKERKDENE